MMFTKLCWLLILTCLNVDSLVLDYAKDPNEEKTVILLAFSGLSADSLLKHDLPTLKKFAIDGVLASGKRGAFQTETLPALHTLVTGRFPDKHGMISNKMRDLSNGLSFDVFNKDEKWWDAVEPIWVTNEKRNKTKSALCFWPGYDVEIGSVKASFTCSTDRNGTKLEDPFKELTLHSAIKQPVMSMDERIIQVLKWVTMEKAPKFIAAYFEELFATALKHGVRSAETEVSVKAIDKLIAKLYKGLEDFKMLEKINVVITSDSAAVDFVKDKNIYLEDYLDERLKNAYDVIDDGPITTILPKVFTDTQILFTKFNGSHPNLNVYKREDLPDSFHFNHANRTMPLILVADNGWRIHPRRITDPNDKRHAAIGYSANNKETQTLLIAHGPAFRKRVRIEEIQNVDVYQMLCAAIQLEPNVHDGSGYVLSKVTAPHDKWYWHIAKTIVQSKEGLTGVIVLFLILLFAVLYLLVHVIYNASSKGRCRCCKSGEKSSKKSNGKYERNGNMNDGKAHLLANEEELSDTDFGEDSDVNEYEVKYARP